MDDTPSGDAVVWFTIDRARFFKVPEGAPLREGSLRLRSLKGQGRAVDAGAARGFEITREEATELLGGQIEAAYGGAREALLKLASWAGQDGLAALTIPERLEDFIGLPTGSIITDPDRVRERVREAMGGDGDAAPDADEPGFDERGAAGFTERSSPLGEADEFTDELLGEGTADGGGEAGPEQAARGAEADDAEDAPHGDAPRGGAQRPEDLLEGAVREAGQKLRAVLRSPEVTGAIESFGERLRRLAEELREESAAQPRDDDNVVEFPSRRRPTPEDPEA